MNMDVLKLLQSWFTGRCDGEWEHQFGIKIETIDNPGWSVSIGLSGVKSGLPFEKFERLRGDDDWINCEVREGVFVGFGGPCNLSEILEVFLLWQVKCSN